MHMHLQQVYVTHICFGVRCHTGCSCGTPRIQRRCTWFYPCRSCWRYCRSKV